LLLVIVQVEEEEQRKVVQGEVLELRLKE